MAVTPGLAPVAGIVRVRVASPTRIAALNVCKVVEDAPLLADVLADQIVVVGEIGFTWILGMEDPSELRYEGPGTFTSGSSWYTDVGIQPETQLEGFADSFSMGYRIAARADFNNAIGAFNLQPAIALSHDVVGTTPLPLGNFVEGRMVVTIALTFNYLNNFNMTKS